MMNKVYLRKFGKHLRKLRQERGLTQEDLALSDEISRSTISMVEIAQNDITLSKLKLIADAMGLKVKDLFDFE